MMILALVATLMCGLVQDDPAVSYREGLFEEVDQAHLDKAIVLYAKVLKSGAPAALKAKALYRQGFCLEKLGKKKEADQAYRDIAEQYASEVETAKLARERLAGLDSKNGAPKVSFDQQIQQYILDLGSNIPATRNMAIRKLTLIGGASLGDLQRAAAHKDPLLSTGAAHVLVDLEQYEGVYEVFLRAMQQQEYPGNDAIDEERSLHKLLKAREADRRRLVKDIATWSSTALMRFGAYVVDVEDPALNVAIEGELSRYLLKGEFHGNVMNAWVRRATPKQVIAMLGTAKKSTFPQNAVSHLLRYGEVIELSKRKEGAAIASEFIAWVKTFETPGRLGLDNGMDSWRYFLDLCSDYMSGREFLDGPIATWLKSKDAESRRMAARLTGPWDRDRYGNKKVWPSKWNEVLLEYAFEVLLSDAYTEDVKLVFLGDMPEPEKLPADRREMLSRFYLSYLKANEANPTPNQGVIFAGTWHLTKFLPANSPDMPLVLDAIFRWPGLGRFSQEGLRKPGVEAAFRALKLKNPRSRSAALNHLNNNAGADERLLLSKVIQAEPEGDFRITLLSLYSEGFRGASVEARAAELKEFSGWVKAESSGTIEQILGSLVGLADPGVQEVMKEFKKTPQGGIRYPVMRHAVEMKSLPAMLEGLADPEPAIQSLAIRGVAAIASLDAVPHLIKFLDSPEEDIRKEARASLEAIKKHHQEQQEWLKWYDGVKKK